MTYLREFRVNWRAIVGATLGFGSGLSINGYVHSILGPYLLTEFHWSKSDFALLGMVYILGMVFIPLAGRIADVFGTRAAVLLGIIFYPLSFVALSMITGDIRIYFAINVLQLVLCSTTTSTVYCRVIAERFSAARGLALGITACGPAVAGAIGSPLLAAYVEANGWRAGSLAFAAFSAIAGAIVMLLLPAMKARGSIEKPKRTARQDYPAIFRNPAFGIIFLSTFLCSIPYALAQSQLNVMLLDRQLSAAAAGFIISTFATGVMAGRFLLGMALDRFATHWVAAVGMALSGIGLFILASGTMEVGLLMFGVALFGLSYGAESDILGYAVVRYFGIDVYSSVLGVLMAAAGAAMTLGSLVLSFTLARSDSYSLFMALAGIAVFLGSANFLRLRRLDPAPPETVASHGMEGAHKIGA